MNGVDWQDGGDIDLVTWVSAVGGGNEEIHRVHFQEMVPQDGDYCHDIQWEMDHEVDHATEGSEGEDARSDLLVMKDGAGGDQANGGDENQKDACTDVGTAHVPIWNIHFEGSIWVKLEDGRGGHKVSRDAQKAILEVGEDSAAKEIRKGPAEVDGAQDCHDTQNDCFFEKDEGLGRSWRGSLAHALEQIHGNTLFYVPDCPCSLEEAYAGSPPRNLATLDQGSAGVCHTWILKSNDAFAETWRPQSLDAAS